MPSLPLLLKFICIFLYVTHGTLVYVTCETGCEDADRFDNQRPMANKAKVKVGKSELTKTLPQLSVCTPGNRPRLGNGQGSL